jgi:hypothetical protein
MDRIVSLKTKQSSNTPASKVNRGLETPWGRSDHAWFRVQQRRYRVRAPFPNEYPSSKPTDFVVVKQMAPGLRHRVRLRIAEGHPELATTMARLTAHAAHRDDAAQAAFDIADMCPGQCITLAELTELISSYETTTNVH